METPSVFFNLIQIFVVFVIIPATEIQHLCKMKLSIMVHEIQPNGRQTAEF